MLAKNRDRMYTPNISFVHEILDGVEVLYFKDNDTGWIEGLNEFGIGILNSALMVSHDEKEKKIVKKTGKKSKDAPRIKKILSQKTIGDVVALFEEKGNIVKGHTFIASSKENLGYRVEATSKHDMIIKQLNLDEITVRTNHGFEYPDSGYTKGKDYKSSIYRKAQAEKAINRSMNANQIMGALRKKNYSKGSNLNMNRDTSKMVTTGQIVLSLEEKILYYNSFNGKSEVIEYDYSLPEKYTPKLSLELVKDDIDIFRKKVKENLVLKAGQEIFDDVGNVFITEKGDFIY